jgi:hypothetical protein
MQEYMYDNIIEKKKRMIGAHVKNTGWMLFDEFPVTRKYDRTIRMLARSRTNI